MKDIHDERTSKVKVFSWQKMKFRYNYAKKFVKYSNVLDVGCGYGFGKEFFPRLFYYGIDYYKPAIDYARDNYMGEFKVMNAPPLQFPDKLFDNVLCLEVIEHMPREKGEQLLKEMFRVLKPNGILFLTTPNFDNGEVYKKGFRKHHDIEYHSKDMQQMIRKSGFKIIHIGGLVIPFIYGWKWYPFGAKKIYEGAGGKQEGLKKTQSPIPSFVKPFAKAAMSALGIVMIYLGYWFPKKAEYQVIVGVKK